MKKITLAFLLLGAFAVKAQETQQDTIVQSLKESIDEHSMKFAGLDERLAGIESDLGKLTKIKISGYIQAQYDMYDFQNRVSSINGVNNGAPSSLTAPVSNSFNLRRARVKFTYEAADGIKFVLQPDLAIDKVSLKDAYVVLNDRWTKTFSLTVGQFNRPTYEVEFSSGSREFLERTRMTSNLYPSERDLGAKLEANLDTKYQIPLKLQLAIFNGNFGYGAIANQVRDIDSNKDVMARAVYSFKMPNKGLGIDLGAHGFFGSTKILATPSGAFSDVDGVSTFTPTVGTALKKGWYGAEAQVYYDLLGGISLKTEYIAGTNSSTDNTAQTAGIFNTNKVREFKGLYASLIKNVGKNHQAVVRYDEFDPNTNLAGNNVTTAADLKYSTWTFGWQYFYDEHVKIVLGYTMPTNEKSAIIATPDTATSIKNFTHDVKDNVFSIRLQAKF